MIQNTRGKKKIFSSLILIFLIELTVSSTGWAANNRGVSAPANNPNVVIQTRPAMAPVTQMNPPNSFVVNAILNQARTQSTQFVANQRTLQQVVPLDAAQTGRAAPAPPPPTPGSPAPSNNDTRARLIIEMSHARLTARQITLRGQINAAQTDNTNISRQIPQKNARITTINSRIAAINSQLPQLRNPRTRMQRQMLNELTAERNELTAEKRRLEAEVLALGERQVLNNRTIRQATRLRTPIDNILGTVNSNPPGLERIVKGSGGGSGALDQISTLADLMTMFRTKRSIPRNVQLDQTALRTIRAEIQSRIARYNAIQSGIPALLPPN